MSGFVIPDDVVQMIGSAGGEAGRAWLAAVPGIVGDLAARWELTLGPPFEGGCVAWVAPAALMIVFGWRGLPALAVTVAIAYLLARPRAANAT